MKMWSDQARDTMSLTRCALLVNNMMVDGTV